MIRPEGTGEPIGRRAMRVVPLALRLLLVGFLCHLSTKFGFAHKFPPHYISPLWPTGAILFSVLVVSPVRHWWAYTLAAYFTSVITDVRAGLPLSAILFIVAGILEIVIAAIGVRRFADGLRAFDSLRSLLVYVLVAVVVAPFTSAFVGALAGGAQAYWFYWRVWFLSEALAFLMLAPAILSWIAMARSHRTRGSRARHIEACLSGLGLVVITAVVFNWRTAGNGNVPALVYLPLPFLLWAAVRFGPLGVNTALSIVAVVSISGAVHGRGPFATGAAVESVLALQLFLITISLPLMFLAALIAERRERTSVLRESEARFRSMADTAPVLVWMAGPDRLCNYFNRSWLEFTGRAVEQELGNGWVEGVHPDDVAQCLHTFVDAFDARREFTMEYRLRRHDGQYRWVLDTGVPRRAPDGTFLGYIGSANDVTECKQAAQAAQDLSGRLIKAQEDERARLARELHDDVTQRLARLAIDVGRLERGVIEPLRGEIIRGVRAGLVRLSEDVHSLSYQLHPSVLEDLGLADAIRGECERFSRRESIPAQVQVRDLPLALPRDTAVCLFRVAQEALRNVVRHAKARAVEVSLARVSGGLRLAVRDDGIGFDPRPHGSRPSLGHASMRERTRLLGGEVEIESLRGGGTTVVAWVPLKENHDEPSACPSG